MVDSPFERRFGHPPPYVVGIVNVTPDSFSDGGESYSPEDAKRRIELLQQEGADLIEIGGESTRPGSTPISSEEEIARILPLVKECSTPERLAVDTYHAETAKFALSHGVRFINDVSSLRGDPAMASVLATHGAYVTLMFNKDAPLPHATENRREYKDIVQEIILFFSERLEFASHGGISRKNVILDTGMGKFLSHDPKFSWEVLRRYDELSTLNQPFMIGTSRKGFLGGKLSERDPLSQLTSLIAVTKGAQFVRTHNVKMAGEFIRTIHAAR